MKITFILPGYGRKPIGGYRVVYEYANQFVSRGHEVSVVHPIYLLNSFKPKMSLYKNLRNKAAQVRDRLIPPHTVKWQYVDPRVNLSYVPTPDAKYVPDADAVIATAWQTAEYVEKYPLTKGEKFYLIQHYEIWSGPKKRVDATWKSNLHKIVIAKWLYKLAKQMGIDDVIHIPNAIDHKKFRLVNSIKNRKQRISMLFSTTELKGSKDGIKALLIAKEVFPELSAVLFGVGPRSKIIPQWIEYVQNPSQDYLVKNIYNGSSMYLCSSWMEGWHLPPAEAMACGCAVVSTDIGGVRDYAIDGETALLSPPRNPEKLAENIIKLIKDDNLRIQIAKRGRSNILNFTWEHSAAMFENFLKDHLSL